MAYVSEKLLQSHRTDAVTQDWCTYRKRRLLESNNTTRRASIHAYTFQPLRPSYLYTHTKEMASLLTNTFWIKGMEYAKRNISETEANRRRFVSLFGTSPTICTEIWAMIEPRIPFVLHHHLLWGLLFLKLYANEAALCGMVGGVDEKTFRKWSWTIIEAISGFKLTVVSLSHVVLLYCSLICTHLLNLVLRLTSTIGFIVKMVACA